MTNDMVLLTISADMATGNAAALRADRGLPTKSLQIRLIVWLAAARGTRRPAGNE
jgi:hypothetical protein